MNKIEMYFKEIQKLAVNLDCPFEYLEKVDIFLNTQTILKRNKIKTKEDKIKIWFIEYINHKLKTDYFKQNNGRDIFTFLSNKISEVCLELKDVSIDSVLIPCILNKKDVINNIILKDFPSRQNRIKELELELNMLKKGMI